jgi:HSP20 family protein
MVDEMSTIMDSMLDEMNSQNYFRSSAPGVWQPAVNIYEVGDRVIVCVDLAGMHREQIDIRVKAGALHIRGARPRPEIPEAPDDVSVLLMEIDSGRFSRKVPLPEDVDVDGVRASYRNGFVWIIIPRDVEQRDGREQ